MSLFQCRLVDLRYDIGVVGRGGTETNRWLYKKYCNLQDNYDNIDPKVRH